MRRPLFWVCLCLVVIASWIDRSVDWSTLSGSCIVATGQVYQKDTEYFYLDSIILEQDAAVQQQTIPFTEKLICEYPDGFELYIFVDGFCKTGRGRSDGPYPLQSHFLARRNRGGQACHIICMVIWREHCRYESLIKGQKSATGKKQ